ncbi:MAG: transcriptional repressor [Spirochaetes bacterium GWF1_31_7]|nr:MAG: transcriptional repressor [Spirochaetes bacterium GWE1_32_154]OHD46938.1 MAG: transcriptional repressor [Spirochaetes bacterium GWF1_31_7]OHD48716.1 MAG: transcriptional repressor [Spirochaetes bacterium GWE2_31_10]OHD82595.1 MAG: transcriptional repressor [Spirochaetes bacterium RIFOXYB1_FULL_32_8]HBD95555.1 transcriptional repressor [Spirochaetia bacterium]
MRTIDLLKSKGVSPSQQRIQILEYLLKNKIHPSVDTIFQNLVNQIPTLSKTTVYNTLALLREKQLIQVIIDNNEIRYDADTEFHGHFKCLECGAIYDFPISEIKIDISSIENFQISEKHIYYTGICALCIKKKGDENGNKT